MEMRIKKKFKKNQKLIVMFQKMKLKKNFNMKVMHNKNRIKTTHQRISSPKTLNSNNKLRILIIHKHKIIKLIDKINKLQTKIIKINKI